VYTCAKFSSTQEPGGPDRKITGNSLPGTRVYTIVLAKVSLNTAVREQAQAGGRSDTTPDVHLVAKVSIYYCRILIYII
jgi:hypothetical protein